MKLTYLCIAALCIATALTAFAADPVVVTEIKDNKGGIYKAVELEEGGKFFHDRDYTITNIPKDFVGLTQVLRQPTVPVDRTTDSRLKSTGRLISTKHGTADIQPRKNAGRIRKTGLQRDIPIPAKSLCWMPHMPQPSTTSTNLMNRIQTEQWNCSALMRSSETQSSCGRSSSKKVCFL